jgi:CubicO group peptidase (beta-lactamase class C family)
MRWLMATVVLPRTAALLVWVLLSAGLLLGGCSGTDEEPDTNSSSAPIAEQVGDAVHDQITAAGPDLAALQAAVVVQDGETVFEEYYGTTAERYQDIESVTKSVMSTLVGIAVDEGDITGLEATLGELLPQYRDTMTPEVAAATLEQVLTMTAGFTGSLSDPGLDWLNASDPGEVILSTTQSPPGQQFHYSNGAAHLLTTILETATGTPILAYARQKLLDPLGVDSTPAYQPLADPTTLADPKRWDQFQEADFAWPIDQTGNNLGFAGLKLKPVDMAVFGSLFLNDGAIDGHQVVPASWVDEATQAHTDAGATGPAPKYGYMWWVNEVDGTPAYLAYGFGGQVIQVVPDRDLVIVLSGALPDLESQGVPYNSALYLADSVIAPLFAS